nr:hypothetical protein [Tanacetum cinerariifolium]
MVERNDKFKVLGEINLELHSSTDKVIDKPSQEKYTHVEALEKFSWKVVRDHEINEAYEEFSSLLDIVIVKLSEESESPGTAIDWQHDPLHETEDFFGGLDQPIQVVVAQNNVHEEVAEEVIEIANDQVEAPPMYGQEVTDECLDDKHAVETRPRVNREVKHCKINIEDNENPIPTRLEIPHGLHMGRNFLESFGGHCNDPILLVIKIPSMLHLEGKIFESCGYLLLVRKDDIGFTQFSIYEMTNESSVWMRKGRNGDPGYFKT